jgi:hypothetical protein
MLWKYILGWFVLLVLAVINGGFRDTLYKSMVGELAAHQISTLTGIILFGIVIWGMTRLWPIATEKEAWIIGSIWLGMTVCFEFLFGHFVMGHPWSKLLHDYNILEGRVWILILIWTFTAPYVFFRFGQRNT